MEPEGYMYGGIYEPKALPLPPKPPVYMVVTPCGKGPYQICGRFYGPDGGDGRIFAALEAGAIQLDGGYPCGTCGPQRAVRVIKSAFDPFKVEVLYSDEEFYKPPSDLAWSHKPSYKPLGLIWP